MPLTATVRVRTYELDSFGHVNNSAYLNYCEEARSEYLKQMGLSFHDFARLGVQFVIVESFVRYITPARYGDTLVIRGGLRDFRASSGIFDYTLTEETSRRLVASAWTKGAFIDAISGRPVRIPIDFRNAFRAVQEDDAPGKEDDGG